MSTDTRRALVAAAIDTLRESGFAAASARRIAQRAQCNPALVFYHFGTVTDLLMAALEDISARRMDAYRSLLDRTGTVAELIDAAREVFEADLDAGHVTVLTEMICGAQSVPGLAPRVAACLAPWRDFAEQAIRDVLAASPAARLLPADEAAHAVVAGLLGLEMLASLSGDRDAALALFDRARTLGDLLDRLGPLAGLLGLGPAREKEGTLCRPTSSPARSATRARRSSASCARPGTACARSPGIPGAPRPAPMSTRARLTSATPTRSPGT